MRGSTVGVDPRLSDGPSEDGLEARAYGRVQRPADAESVPELVRVLGRTCTPGRFPILVVPNRLAAQAGEEGPYRKVAASDGR
jgi:hypothetical protein